MRLSAHFDTSEFACHDGTPAPAFSRDELRHLCVHHLEPLRARWGPVEIISGYRHYQYNVSVGGAPRSYHVYERERWGVAADVRALSGTPRDWARTLERRNPGGLGVYTQHVHVDNRAGHARW